MFNRFFKWLKVQYLVANGAAPAVPKSDLDAAIQGWIAEEHPQLAGCPIRSIGWQVDMCWSTDELASVASQTPDVVPSDFEPCVSRLVPPAGFIFVTVDQLGQRVLLNVPVSVHGRRGMA